MPEICYSLDEKGAGPTPSEMIERVKQSFEPRLNKLVDTGLINNDFLSELLSPNGILRCASSAQINDGIEEVLSLLEKVKDTKNFIPRRGGDEAPALPNDPRQDIVRKLREAMKDSLQKKPAAEANPLYSPRFQHLIDEIKQILAPTSEKMQLDKLLFPGRSLLAYHDSNKGIT